MSCFILKNKGSLDFVFRKTVNDYKTYDRFVKVEIDDKEIRSYKVKKGSLIITLDSSYLNKLSAGIHTMKVFFTDGSCSTPFIVEKKQESYSLPVTGIN